MELITLFELLLQRGSPSAFSTFWGFSAALLPPSELGGGCSALQGREQSELQPQVQHRAHTQGRLLMPLTFCWWF